MDGRTRAPSMDASRQRSDSQLSCLHCAVWVVPSVNLHHDGLNVQRNQNLIEPGVIRSVILHRKRVVSGLEYVQRNVAVRNRQRWSFE